MKSGQPIFFVAGALVKEHAVGIYGMTVPLQMTWADGMIGVMPIFDSRKAAGNYSKGRFPIYVLQQQEEKKTPTLKKKGKA